MALLVSGPEGVDLSILDVATLLDGVIVTRTSTVFRLDVGDGSTTTLMGSGFQYDSSGEPVGGTITGITSTYQGSTVFELTSISVPVSTFVHWVETGDTTDFFDTVFAGADTLDASSSSGSVLFGLGGDDLILGSPGEDVILGGAGADSVNGRKDDDLIEGGGGNDRLLGGQGDDLIFGGAGADLVNGNLGADTIVGEWGGDTLHGGQGNDRLVGGSGDDHLFGDLGDDRLTGGVGADTLHFSVGGGRDIVTDFIPEEGDRLQIDPGVSYTVSIVGLDTVVDLGDGDQFTLLGVQTTSLPSSWLV